MKYYGLNPIKVEGSSFEIGYGYSKFVDLKINGKKYKPIIAVQANTFGVKNWEDRKKEKIYSRVEDKKEYLEFYAKSGNVDLNGPFIAGISIAKLGQSVWGPTSGFYLGKMKDYKKMEFTTKWVSKIKGFGNFVYDIWFSRNKIGSLDDKKDVEVEIWLSSNFNPPGEKIGETEDFVIFHKEKNHNGKHWFNLALKEKTNKNSFDLKDILKHIQNKVNYIEDLYIRSIDFGSEYAKNSKVETKVYKINFDFKK